jgi:antitoxin component YwqK of YwqJK toxin-antitoxin module
MFKQFKDECANIIKDVTYVHTKYYKNNTICFEKPYINGKLHGICKEYHVNGNIKKECYYIKGNKNGVCKEYYENGNIKLICNYRNNVLHGEYIRYNELGESVYELTYIEGKPTKSV